MKIRKLLENVVILRALHYKDIDVDGVEIDTGKPLKGKVFVCLKGGNVDSHTIADKALKAGAVALISEQELPFDVPIFVVKSTRRALALIAGNFYGNPAQKLNIVTVVGTNGKTSTTEILSHIFSYAGIKCAAIGTLGYKIGKDRVSGELTTPDPMELHRHLAEMYQAGVKCVFMEASAHAIFYDKLAGIKAKASILTNITQDHLDFFEDMDQYASVKLSYFTYENTALAVLNSDDEYALRILREPSVPVITYGLNNPSDVFAIDLGESEAGISFTVNAFDCIETILCPLHGTFNVYNIMAAISVAMYMGISLSVIKNALSQMEKIPGRYNVDYVNGIKTIIDYAHTPDGLENLLKDVKKSTTGKVITVFGCGGNRDRRKRPLMGKIASEYSDYVIITEDNPRYEKVSDISNEIKEGILADCLCESIEDRTEAIKRAFELASQGDTIVLAGKGHEAYIEKNGEKIPYSDSEVLQKSKE